MKKIYTTIFMVAIGVITSFAQVYTVNITPNNPEWGEVEIGNHLQGVIQGVFSVSATKKVVFSKGNLQYQASTNTWRFAENQYDMVGIGYGQTDEGHYCYVGGTVPNSDNREISSRYDGWIDLFGWGTGNNPTNVSTNYADYSTFVDWGVNKISNGGNQAGLWRTLTSDEWIYLLFSRTNYDKLWSLATVNGISGVVLLPDSWSLPSGLTFTAKVLKDFDTNVYTVAQWTKMENAGAVFLPAAGIRYGTSMSNVGRYCTLWSSSYSSVMSKHAYSVIFELSDGYGLSNSGYYYGLSVRLCSEISIK